MGLNLLTLVKRGDYSWLALAAGCLLVGCQREQADEAPLEIRGAPITKLTAKPKPAGAPPLTNQAPVSQVVETNEELEPGFKTVGFDKLASFKYEMPDDLNPSATPQTNSVDQIPPNIRQLNKTGIALKGFMLPLKVDSGLVTEMLIMRDQSMCCYGTVPKINEWVSVKMASKGVKPVMDQPVILLGKLHVGEMYENGYLVGIYKMDGEKMLAD